MKKFLKVFLLIISFYIIYNIEKEIKIITTKNTNPKSMITNNTESKNITTNNTEPKIITTNNTESKHITTNNTEPKIITTNNTESKNITTNNIESKNITTNNTEPKIITTNNTDSKKMDTKESTSYNFYILISELRRNRAKRNPKYILLFDFLHSKYCYDHNSYLIFQYYQERNKTEAYYIINKDSDLYNSLLLKNKTNNLILYDPKDKEYLKNLYPYLLNSKIMIFSYVLYEYLNLVNSVYYLKFLKINHGIRYFKNRNYNELISLYTRKRNTIISSPYEYDIYKNKFYFFDNEIHKGGLPRYDRLNKIRKNKAEKECILIFFTYRSYDNERYDISLLKKNIIKLLEDNTLISFLRNKNIDLIYIQHHHDIKRNRSFEFYNFTYAKYKRQVDLSHYIEQCSLLVTDFSSVSFDFIFQNKPSLFYLLDYDETFFYNEKIYIKFFPKSKFVKNNTFYEQNSLVNKILYYAQREFKIEDNLKEVYEKVFYYKNNITERVVKIIDNIIEKNN